MSHFQPAHSFRCYFHLPLISKLILFTAAKFSSNTLVECWIQLNGLFPNFLGGDWIEIWREVYQTVGRLCHISDRWNTTPECQRCNNTFKLSRLRHFFLDSNSHPNLFISTLSLPVGPHSIHSWAGPLLFQSVSITGQEGWNHLSLPAGSPFGGLTVQLRAWAYFHSAVLPTCILLHVLQKLIQWINSDDWAKYLSHKQ